MAHSKQTEILPVCNFGVLRTQVTIICIVWKIVVRCRIWGWILTNLISYCEQIAEGACNQTPS
jgi:hypothetical protein